MALKKLSEHWFFVLFFDFLLCFVLIDHGSKMLIQMLMNLMENIKWKKWYNSDCLQAGNWTEFNANVKLALNHLHCTTHPSTIHYFHTLALKIKIILNYTFEDSNIIFIIKVQTVILEARWLFSNAENTNCHSPLKTKLPY